MTYEVHDSQSQEARGVTFLYNNLMGRLLLKLLIRTPMSKLMGAVMDSSASRVLIKGFIRRNNINMGEYKDTRFLSFNNFFTREIKNGLRLYPDSLCDLAAPCDGRLSAFHITGDSMFHIKNSVYDIAGLLQDELLAEEFVNGICLIFRLTPVDYHRYAFIDDGEILRHKQIKGVLHTVRPISLKRYNVYAQNSREYMLMQTKNFGKMVQMEVGALFIGRIANYALEGSVRRGQEKGMFEFGGSTVILLFQQDAITIDKSIYDNTKNNYETIVKMGSRIGTKGLAR